MVEIKNYVEAISSVGTNLLGSPCEGRFRKVSLSTIDYFYRISKGKKLSFGQKRILGIVLTLGKNINDYYDTGIWESDKYIVLRREFKNLLPERNNDFVRYQRMVSQIEKQRPTPSGLLYSPNLRERCIVSYRERVNRVYLAFSFAVALNSPISDYYENYKNKNPYEIQTFDGFFNSLMAMQVVDDLVGRRGDLKNDRPSFYTAFCPDEDVVNRSPVTGSDYTLKRMDGMFNLYLNNAERHSLKILKPVLSAVKFTRFIYPGLTEFSRKIGFLGSTPIFDTLSPRDRNNL